MTEESLFDAAMTLPDAAGRRAFVAEACAGDPALRARVERLLDADAGANPLDRPASATPALPGGTVAGRYALGQRLSEGGMGTVFVAEQVEPVRRRVALKFIKAGADSADVVERFRRERQALALMDHPNIAKVFDAGEDGGRPFLAMELVEGPPLTEYCDGRRLTLRRRLELFASTCDAVNHAHQKGVIHRDIKPSNILVAEIDGRPVPKLIDFGIAKASRRPAGGATLTEAGSLIGTPEYMSPEQAALDDVDIDTRSDVYSLGVVLYELLTGRVPLSRGDRPGLGLMEMLRLLREEVPAKPSTRLRAAETLPGVAANRATEPGRLASAVRGELDWIVMKALERDRERRYGGPAALADDVRRSLAGEAVRAAPPSRSYRLRTFARRNRAAVVAAGLLFLSLVLGIAGTGYGLVRADEGRDEAERSAAEARLRAGDAEAALGLIEEQIFGAARPRDSGGGLGSEVTLREAIEASLPAIGRRFGDRPLLEARLRLALGRTLVTLGEGDSAWRQLRRVLDLMANAGRGPDDPDVMAASTALAASLTLHGRHAEALGLWRDLAERWRTRLGASHPTTLTATRGIGACLSDMGDYAQALPIFEAVQAAALAQDPPDPLAVASARSDLGRCLSLLGREREALGLREQALRAARDHLPPGHSLTAKFMCAAAASLNTLGRLAEGAALIDEALPGMRRDLGPAHPETLMAASNLCWTLGRLRRHEEAIRVGTETLAAARGRATPGDPLLLNVAVSAAANLADAGRLAEAAALAGEHLSGPPSAPDKVLVLRLIRLNHFVAARDHAAARREAQECEGLPLSGPIARFRLACAWGIAACVDPAGPNGPDGDRAMGHLAAAVRLGVGDANGWPGQPDLNGLRGRRDFRELVLGVRYAGAEALPPPGPAR